MVQLFLILLMVIANIIFYGYLPANIPIHWNIYGQIDSYMAKNIGIWLMPIISIVMVIFFKYIPSFDPKKSKYKLFQKEWNIMQTAILGFLVYMHFLMLYFAVYPGANFMNIFFVGFGTFFVLIGNYMSKIRQNYFIGVRTPWTLDNEDNWNKTHRYASWCFVITGIITIIEAFVLWLPAVIIFSSIIISAIFPILYSFLLYKKKESMMKFIHWGLLVVVLFIILVKGLSGEDDWICKNGQWIRHGNPSSQMPTNICN